MTYNYSIIIPYRDKYDLFAKAVESIPDRDDIQIIVVDNALEPLSEKDIPKKSKAVVAYSQSSPTGGAGCARNVGLKNVDGKYIIFLDADDYFTANAFSEFDRYLDSEYDIVYFDADSVCLGDGSQSTRHEGIHKYITNYLHSGNEDRLRYRFFNPIPKMFRAAFVKESGVLFDEIPVSNDVWFSFMTGHLAKHITADAAVVYMITEGETGSTLTKIRSKENMFTRYKVSVRVNRFLNTIGKSDLHVKLSGFLNIAFKEFGVIEFIRYLAYACQKRVSVF